MHCLDWKQNFLASRNLDAFDGSPIYSYRMDDEEYLELKVVLEFDLDALCDITSHVFTTCIVLYFCEWWRREYQGSKWSWRPLFESLGANTPKPALRAQIVEKGLKLLQRPVLKTDNAENEYLGTIAFESGIPRSLLVDDHYFSKVITDCYLQFLEISSYELTELDIVEKICLAKRIPNVYQNDFFYELIKKIVDDLINLNNRFDLRSSKNPVEFLDLHYPDWDYYFPIPPDSEIAVSFINQLLSDTSKNRDVAPLKSLNLNCRLVKRNDVYSIHQVLNIDDGIIDSSTLGVTLDEWNNLSDVLELYAVYESKERRLLGSLFKVTDAGKFSSPGFKNIVLSNSIFESTEIIIEDPITVKSISLRVDAPNLLENESPLIFKKVGEYWELKSVGSSSLKESTYRVLALDNFNLSNYLSELNFNETGVRLFEVEEPCTISDAINSYRLVFSSKEEEIRYHILPASSDVIPYYPNKNKHVYLGMPRIYQVNSKGILLERMRQGIEYLNADGNWSRIKDRVFGKCKIRKKDPNGYTLFSLTINVLPPDFSIEFVPGLQKASVILNGTSNFKKVVLGKIESTIGNNAIIFNSIDSTEEEYFQVKLYSVSSKTPVQIQIPIPKDLSSFRGEDGDLIGASGNVFMGGLFGKSFLTNNLKGTTKTGQLSLSLYDPNIPKPIISKFNFEIDPFGTFELPLIKLKRRLQILFSLTENNDSLIRLKYESNQITIRQFDSKPYFLNGNVSFRNPISEVLTFRLDADFSKDPGFVKSKPIPEDGLLSEESFSEGLWFVYPSKNSEDFFCPIVLNKTKIENFPSEINSISSASRIREFNERQVALKELLIALSSDLRNGQWTELIDLYKETDHLPLATLDVWKAASKTNKFISALFFLMPEEFIQRFSEEFSILWRAIKISDWEIAFKNYYDYISSQGLDEEIVKNILYQKTEAIGSILRLMTIKSYMHKDAEPLPFALYRHIMNEELNGTQGKKGLRTRRIEQEWPDHLNDDIRSWIRVLPKEFKELFDSVSSHQKAVVFLPIILAFLTADKTLIIQDLDEIYTRFLIEQVKQFDPEWFEKAFDYTQGYLLTKEMQNG